MFRIIILVAAMLEGASKGACVLLDTTTKDKGVMWKLLSNVLRGSSRPVIRRHPSGGLLITFADSRLDKWATSFSRTTAVVVCLSGILVLLGWSLDVSVLKSIVPGMASMKANTALAFTAAGLALLALGPARLSNESTLTTDRLRRLAQGGAVVVGLVGLLTLGEYLTGWDLRIDQLLFHDAPGAAATSSPGRMSPLTAVNCLFLGTALLLLDNAPRSGFYASELLSLAVALVSLFASLGYLFDVEPLYRLHDHTAMAVHTSVGFLGLSTAVIFARPNRGLMVRLVSNNAGGALARRLLPPAVFVPIVLAWLRLAGQRAGLYSTEFGLALYASAIVLTLSVLIWMTARTLGDTDMERLATEGALRESESRLRALTESLPQLVWTCLPDGRCDYLSPQWVAYTGISAQEQLSFGWANQLHPDDQQRAQDTWETAVKDGDTLDTEFRIRRADGAYRWFKTRAVPFRNAVGHVIRWFGTSTDIDDLKKAEEAIRHISEELDQRVRDRTAELEGSNKELEAFSYSVSHDLRAPLRAIDGYSRIVLEDYGERLDSEGRRVLGVVRSETQRMSQLMDDLLTFSRLNRQELNATTIDMGALAQSAFDEVTAANPDRRVGFTLEPLPPAHGEPLMLRQVWINLLANAVKFTGQRDDAAIEVRCDRSPSEVTYHIKDNGVGFAMAHADKLFGVFQRLHSEEEFPGTGVGLALVQRVIARHGGRVWAEAQINQGATFYFSLPARKESHS